MTATGQWFPGTNPLPFPPCPLPRKPNPSNPGSGMPPAPSAEPKTRRNTRTISSRSCRMTRAIGLVGYPQIRQGQRPKRRRIRHPTQARHDGLRPILRFHRPPRKTRDRHGGKGAGVFQPPNFRKWGTGKSPIFPRRGQECPRPVEALRPGIHPRDPGHGQHERDHP